MLPPLLILAGGKGTRVAHLSGYLPKNLISINGTTFLELQLNLLRKVGVKHFVYSVGHKENFIRDCLNSLSVEDVKIEIVSDGEYPLGTGGAIFNALPKLGKEFLVTYGDSYLELDYVDFYLSSSEFGASMAIYKNENLIDKSNVKKTTGTLISYLKGTSDKEFNFIDYGLLYFKSEVFKRYFVEENPDLADLLFKLSKDKLLHGFEVSNRFYEIGSESGLAELREHIKE